MRGKTTAMTTVSVLIPAYNEEATILELLEKDEVYHAERPAAPSFFPLNGPVSGRPMTFSLDDGADWAFVAEEQRHQGDASSAVVDTSD